MQCHPRLADLETSDGNVIDGERRSMQSNTMPIPSAQMNHHSNNAGKKRDDLAEYFSSSAGSVLWQLAHIHSTASQGN